MATIQSSLRLYALSDLTIAGLIGTRMYPVRGPSPLPLMPNGSPAPYAVYRFPIIKDDNTLASAPDADGQVQIECYAPDYDTAWAVTDAFRAALAYFRGPMGGTDGIVVSGCVRLSARDEDQPQQGLFKVVSEFEMIWPL